MSIRAKKRIIYMDLALKGSEAIRSCELENSFNGSLNIETFIVGPFQMNTYLVSDPVSKESVLIDPGGDIDRISAQIKEKEVKLKYILNTHCHIDHVAEGFLAQNLFKVPMLLHKNELPLLESLKEQGLTFGIEISGIPQDLTFVQDKDTISLGKVNGKILHTPGHSPGSISLHINDYVFVGDCLFMDSIGRTDLYRGDYEQLIHAINNKLLVLDEHTEVYPGHGPKTTIGREKKFNPFLQE
jgi:hydroxyacylglutathione hydrolase